MDIFRIPLLLSLLAVATVSQRSAKLRHQLRQLIEEAESVNEEQELREQLQQEPPERKRKVPFPAEVSHDDGTESGSGNRSRSGSGSGRGSRFRGKRAIYDFEQLPEKKWPLPIEYKISPKYSASDVAKIEKALATWQNGTCLRFKRLGDDETKTESHVLFTPAKRGCFAYIGRTEQRIPQEINLQTPSCLFMQGTILHEIGHMIGLSHEHQRADRKQFVEVLDGNARGGAAVDLRVKAQHEQAFGLPYDLSSVMHAMTNYLALTGKQTFRTRDPMYQNSLGQRQTLTFWDRKLVNQAYCSEKCSETKKCINHGYANPNDCARCLCRGGYGGATCEGVQPSDEACPRARDAPLDAAEGWQCVASPERRAAGYASGSSCNWRLLAPAGRKIELKFSKKLNLYQHPLDKSCLHWVEVNFDPQTMGRGPRFCGRVPSSRRPLFGGRESLTTKSNEALITFRSHFRSKYKRSGFELCYRLRAAGDGN